MCFDSIGEIPREPFLSVYSHFNPRCLNQHNIRKLFWNWGKKETKTDVIKTMTGSIFGVKNGLSDVCQESIFVSKKNQLKLKKSK